MRVGPLFKASDYLEFNYREQDADAKSPIRSRHHRGRHGVSGRIGTT